MGTGKVNVEYRTGRGGSRSEEGRGNGARGTFPLVSRQLLRLEKGAHREGGKEAEGG